MEEEESVLRGVQANQNEVCVADETTPRAKCKSVAADKKCQPSCNKTHDAVLYHMVRTKAEISKVFNENVCHIFTPHRTSLNESKPRLTERMFND